MYGIIETATGNLKRASWEPMTPGTGESARSDVPEPPLFYPTRPQYHRWTGSEWELATTETFSDEFDGTTLDAKWSWVNQGSAYATLAESYLTLKAPISGGSNSLRCLVQTLTAPWTVVLNCRGFNLVGGLIMRDSGSGRIMMIGLDVPGDGLFVHKWNSATNKVNANPFSNTPFCGMGDPTTFRVRNDGTTLGFDFSPDGINFIQLYSEAKSVFLPNVNQVGVAAYAYVGNKDSYLFADYIRKV